MCIERLERRNAGLPRFNFWIGAEMLEGFVQLFERPSEDEGAELVVVPDDARAMATVRASDEFDVSQKALVFVHASYAEEDLRASWSG